MTKATPSFISASPKVKAANAKVAQARMALKKRNNLIPIYLALYNLGSALAWAYFGYLVYRTLLTSKTDFTILLHKTIHILCYVQATSILEVLHAAIGLVPSKLFSTIMQIASRLFVAFVPGRLLEASGGYGGHGYLMVAIAWTLSDLTRYVYYLLNLGGCAPYPLIWARYSLFLILYPLGTIGEVLMIWQASKMVTDDLHRYLLWGVLAIYPLGFLFMYNHMLRQRSKYLTGVNAARLNKAKHN